MNELIKTWLESMYKEAISEHESIAHHEHLCALGSPDMETANMHEANAEMHREFIRIAYNMIGGLYTNGKE